MRMQIPKEKNKKITHANVKESINLKKKKEKKKTRTSLKYVAPGFVCARFHTK